MAPRPIAPLLGVRWVRVGLLTCVMLLAVQLVAAGYEYGRGEQTLLSIKGISWADRSAFVNDWFNDRAPQPHILFDVITYLGESTHTLPFVYFAYWLASLVVLAWGITVLADQWLPPHLRTLELVVGTLVVVGPYFVLGTFLIVHREAVPNALGGALGFLTLSFLVARRHKAAALSAAATTALHVQHGAVVAALLALTWIFTSGRFRAAVVRWYPLVVAAILSAVLAVASIRGLVSGTEDVVEICTIASPGHCDPDSWSSTVVRDGLLVLAAALVAPWLGAARNRLLPTVLVLGPVLAITTSLATDLLDVEPFQSLGRQLFLYRFGMVVAPLAAWAIVLLMAQIAWPRPRWVRLVLPVAGVLALVWWCGASYANLSRFTPSPAGPHRAGAVLGLTLVIALGLVTLVRSRRPDRRRLTEVGTWFATVGMVAATLAYGSQATGPVALRIGYPPDDGSVAIGKELERVVPVGGVLAHSPDVPWVRLLSRRAVVGNCKAVPYGGQPWAEYKERMVALGASTPLQCGSEGFSRLRLGDIERLRDDFGATHVLLTATDDAQAVAQAAGWPLLWDSQTPSRFTVFAIPDTEG